MTTHVLVPVVPTDEMVDAMVNVIEGMHSVHLDHDHSIEALRAAIAAAPPPAASVPDLGAHGKCLDQLRAVASQFTEASLERVTIEHIIDLHLMVHDRCKSLLAKSRADGERIGVLVEELEKARQLVQLAHEQGAFKNSEQVHSLLNDGLWSIDAAIKRAKS